ncbi:MAG: hypothetical protein KFKLKKLM_02680 [Flavobacteriales bacterium]|nr:hypothetical protein [Flavobacteriales bacterium]
MKYIKLIFLLFLSNLSFGQVDLNPGIDTSSLEHKNILKFWTEYLKTKPSKNSQTYLAFWNEDIKKQFIQPDLTLHAINTEHSTFSMGYPTILSILPYKDNYFQIKTAMGWSDSTKHIKLLSITNHYTKMIDGEYKLFSPLQVDENIVTLDTNDFKISTLKGTTIPKDTLEELTRFISKIRSDYNITERKKLTIIYGTKDSKTDRILGFDFNLMSSTNNPTSGISDLSNNLIVLNGLNPIFHETTHIYLNPLFTETPLLEGLATFYGGSMGTSLSEGIKYLHSHISTVDKDVNLYAKLKESYYFIDNKHNPIYTLQGLLIQIAYDKGGVTEIKKLLSYPDHKTIFNVYFKISEKDADKFIRQELKKRTKNEKH